MPSRALPPHSHKKFPNLANPPRSASLIANPDSPVHAIASLIPLKPEKICQWSVRWRSLPWRRSAHRRRFAHRLWSLHIRACKIISAAMTVWEAAARGGGCPLLTSTAGEQRLRWASMCMRAMCRLSTRTSSTRRR
jgi:hypothetical protein